MGLGGSFDNRLRATIGLVGQATAAAGRATTVAGYATVVAGLATTATGRATTAGRTTTTAGRATIAAGQVAKVVGQAIVAGVKSVTPDSHRDRQASFAAHDLPAPPRTAGTVVQTTVDELILGGFRLVGREPSEQDAKRIIVETEEAVSQYRHAGWLDDPARAHPAPGPPGPTTHRRVWAGRMRAEMVSWSSDWHPAVGEPGRERWEGFVANREARTLVFRHPGPARPWVICVHPAESGHTSANLVMFRVAHLHRHLGLNVALPFLALHGPRRARGDGPFPTLDVMDNVHGLAQSVWDVRRTAAWLRQDGQPIGLMGISLGAYVSSLVTGLDGDFAAVIAGSPPSDFPALFAENLPRTDPIMCRVLEMSVAGHQIVAPLRLPVLVRRERLFVHAGLVDRLAPPVEQAAPLWEHWGRPAVCWQPGGHMGFLVGDSVKTFVDDALVRSGLCRGSESKGSESKKSKKRW